MEDYEDYKDDEDEPVSSATTPTPVEVEKPILEDYLNTSMEYDSIGNRDDNYRRGPFSGRKYGSSGTASCGN